LQEGSSANDKFVSTLFSSIFTLLGFSAYFFAYEISGVMHSFYLMISFNLVFGSHSSSRRVSLWYIPGQQNVRQILQSPRESQAVNEECEPEAHSNALPTELSFSEIQRRGREQKEKSLGDVVLREKTV